LFMVTERPFSEEFKSGLKISATYNVKTQFSMGTKKPSRKKGVLLG
jgi:hypothetical protein